MENRLTKLKTWTPPNQNWTRFVVFDAHTGGEPLRIIVEGFEELQGETILEKRNDAKKRFEPARKLLMAEPRGHNVVEPSASFASATFSSASSLRGLFPVFDMYGAILVDPTTPDGDLGVLFMHNEGYSTMCGHGIIALTTVVFQAELFPSSKIDLKIDTPAGRVTSRVNWDEKSQVVQSVSFRNVPSFCYLSNQKVSVEDLGVVDFDISFGGAFYAYVNADKLGIRMVAENGAEIIRKGMLIKHAVMANFKLKHPYEDDLSFLYGVIFVGDAITNKGMNEARKKFSRNVCVFADGQIDRCPTGTGVSGRVALEFHKGEMQIGDSLVIESIIGTIFTARVADFVEGASSRETGSDKFVSTPREGKWIVDFGGYKDAVIPEVEGDAYITGRSEFFLDPRDSLTEGFLVH